MKAFGGAWKPSIAPSTSPADQGHAGVRRQRPIPVFNDMEGRFRGVQEARNNCFKRIWPWYYLHSRFRTGPWGCGVPDLSRIDKFAYARQCVLVWRGSVSAARSTSPSRSGLAPSGPPSRGNGGDMDLMAFDGGMGNAIGSYRHGTGSLPPWQRVRAIVSDGLADRVDKFGEQIFRHFRRHPHQGKDTWERIGDFVQCVRDQGQIPRSTL